MILPCERFAKTGEIRIQYLDPPALMLFDCRFSANKMQRRPLLGTCLCENESPRREVEGSQPEFSRNFCAAAFPVETAGNHQMKDEIEISFHLNHNALP